MTSCLFVSDLHGRSGRYAKLFAAARKLAPRAVFVGGDVLPHHAHAVPPEDFVREHIVGGLLRLREDLGESFPRFFLILGNDDARWTESLFEEAALDGLLTCAHMRKEPLDRWTVYGYSYVPPTPFRLKDWERYDVSRHVDPGCVSPEEGARSVPVDQDEIRYATMREDLDLLAGDDDLERAVFLLHSPPYQTPLDRAALDGVKVDHVELDVHIGSIAVRRFIEARQPLLTLHGHVHESARLTGAWSTRIGRTVALSAAHDGPELALVAFDLENPGAASRELV